MRQEGRQPIKVCIKQVTPWAPGAQSLWGAVGASVELFPAPKG